MDLKRRWLKVIQRWVCSTSLNPTNPVYLEILWRGTDTLGGVSSQYETAGPAVPEAGGVQTSGKSPPPLRKTGSP